MLSLQELRQYEWIQFYDCRSNLKEKRSGAAVGKYLAVSGYENRWRIYQIYGGLPVLDAYVISLNDAINIASYINEKYGEYLGIYEVWTDVDLLGIARLSVPEGESIYAALCELETLNRTVTYDDFSRLLNSKLHG